MENEREALPLGLRVANYRLKVFSGGVFASRISTSTTTTIGTPELAQAMDAELGAQTGKEVIGELAAAAQFELPPRAGRAGFNPMFGGSS